ncbi:MAG TPA: suppressor of fused domain protein, partial [Rhizobiales bacterium]|nr:suppressor of fused domain protein [Hyphomicrobiales bacterium]
VAYVLTGRDAEKPDRVCHSTIGLSDHKLGQDKGGVALGAELVAACHEDCDYLDRALAVCADLVLNHGLMCKPGVIVAGILEGSDGTSQMKHMLFAIPSLWEDGLYPLSFKSKVVLWLQGIPVSDSEMAYAQQNGPGALGEKLVEAEADILDLRREPAV